MRNNGDLKATLELQVGRLFVEPADLVGKSKRSALFPMSYLALKAKGAKDWRSQLDLSLRHQGRDHSIEYHHIFPRKLLKDANYEADAINEIANMAFIAAGTNRTLSARPAAEYLKEIVEKHGPEALQDHCIPTDPSLWEVAAYPEFLEYRRDALATAINDFIALDKPTVFLDVLTLITKGESNSVEFKASARWDYRSATTNKALEFVIVKSVAGMLNAKGGYLLIGIDDKGHAIGLHEDYRTLSTRPDRDGYEQFLIGLFSSGFGKYVASSLSISFHEIDGQDIAAIQIPKSASPVFLTEGNRERFFVRLGNTTQEMNTKDSVSYIKKHWLK